MIAFNGWEEKLFFRLLYSSTVDVRMGEAERIGRKIQIPMRTPDYTHVL